MNADYRLKPITLLVVLAFLAICLSGCVTGSAYKRGERAAVLKDYETAMTEFKLALDRNPANIEIQLRYEQARFNAAFQHFEAGRRAVDREDYLTAKMEFTRVLEIDPTHVLAEQQLQKINEILSARAANQLEPEIQFDEMRAATRTDPSVQSQLEP